MTGESVLMGIVMAVLGGGCLLLTLVTLPGNWLIVLFAAALQGWALAFGHALPYSGWTLGALFALALVGEFAEVWMSAAGAKAGGARSRGAWGAVLGSMAGALAGTVLLAFLPIAGALVGALMGAALGAFVGELTYGDRSAAALAVPAIAAAAGRFAGIIVKLAFGVAIWTVAVVGALWA